MAVLTASQTTIKPDRYEDYLDVCRKAKTLTEKHGAKNVRLLAALVAGEATGSFIFVSEADDFAAAGAVLDKALSDPEMRTLLSTGTASPYAGYQISQWVDVPL
jgi:hypothetical protein